MKKVILIMIIIAILSVKILAQSSSEVIGTMSYEEYIKKKINPNVQLTGFTEGFLSGELQIKGKEIYFRDTGLILDLDKDIPKSANLQKMEYKDKVLTLVYKDNNKIILESGNMRRYKDLEFFESKDKVVKVTIEGIEIKDGAKLKKIITLNDKEKREVIIQQQNSGEKTTINFISDNYFVGDKNTIINDNVLGKILPKTDSTKFTYDMNNLVTSMVLKEKNPYTVHKINVNMGAGSTVATQITGDKAIEYQMGFNDNGKQIVTAVKLQGTDKYFPLASGSTTGFKDTALEDFINSKGVTKDNKQLITELHKIYHSGSGEGTVERLLQEKDTRGTGIDKSYDKENYVLLGKNVETTSNKIDLQLKGNSASKESDPTSALLVVPEYGNVYSQKDSTIHIGDDKVVASKSLNFISIDKENGIVNINSKDDNFVYEQKHNLKELATNGGKVINGEPKLKFNPDGTINIERDIRMAEYSIDKIVNSNQKNKDSYLTLKYHENVPGYRLADSMGRYTIGTTYVDLDLGFSSVNAATLSVEMDQKRTEEINKKGDAFNKKISDKYNEYTSGKITKETFDSYLNSLVSERLNLMEEVYNSNKEIKLKIGIPIPEGSILDAIPVIPKIGEDGKKLIINDKELMKDQIIGFSLREMAYDYGTLLSGKRPGSFELGLLMANPVMTDEGNKKINQLITDIKTMTKNDVSITRGGEYIPLSFTYIPAGTEYSIGSNDNYGYIKVGDSMKTIDKDYAKALVNLGIFGSSLMPSEQNENQFNYNRYSDPKLLRIRDLRVNPFNPSKAKTDYLSIMSRLK